MLNWGTERYKNFNSALKLDETIRERNRQMELKRKIAEEKKNRDKDDRARQRAALESLMAEEAKTAAEKQKIRLDVAEFQKLQMRGHEEERMKAERENQEEGKKIQAAYREYLEDNNLTAERKKAQKDSFKNDVYTLQQQQQEHARLERHMINEEDSERKITSLARRQLACKRIAKEKEMKKEKDLVKDALYKRLEKFFEEKGDNYDEMVRKAREEEDARIAEEEAEKAAKRKKATDEQMQHLMETMKEHEEEKKRAKEEDVLEGRRLAESAQLFAKDEVAKVEQRRIETKEAELINKRLRVRAAEKIQEKRNESLAIDLFNQINDRKRETEFENYATSAIAEAHNRGGPTYAMQKEKAKILARDKTCDDGFLGKGPLKPTFLTDEEMQNYISRLNIKEDQLCIESQRGRQDQRYAHCQ